MVDSMRPECCHPSPYSGDRADTAHRVHLKVGQNHLSSPFIAVKGPERNLCRGEDQEGGLMPSEEPE